MTTKLFNCAYQTINWQHFRQIWNIGAFQTDLIIVTCLYWSTFFWLFADCYNSRGNVQWSKWAGTEFPLQMLASMDCILTGGNYTVVRAWRARIWFVQWLTASKNCTRTETTYCSEMLNTSWWRWLLRLTSLETTRKFSWSISSPGKCQILWVYNNAWFWSSDSPIVGIYCVAHKTWMGTIFFHRQDR